MKKIIGIVLAIIVCNSLLANNNKYDDNIKKWLSNEKLQEKPQNDVFIESQFSVNGRFYTHSEQRISPQIGYYRLSLTDASGEIMTSNPFTVSDSFSKPAFAFCCDEPDTQEIVQNTVTVIDGLAEPE